MCLKSSQGFFCGSEKINFTKINNFTIGIIFNLQKLTHRFTVLNFASRLQAVTSDWVRYAHTASYTKFTSLAMTIEKARHCEGFARGSPKRP